MAHGDNHEIGKSKRVSAKSIAEFVRAARKHGVKPSTEAWDARFPDGARSSRVQSMRILLEELGEIEKRPAPANHGGRRKMTDTEKAMAEMRRLQAKMEALVARMGGGK